MVESKCLFFSFDLSKTITNGFWIESFILIQEHHQDFPALLLMARDYLACSATSASVERCFSAAADICAEDRGSLAPRTIERYVNSHQWLQKGYQANGDFQTAQSIITQGMDDLKTKNKRPKACNIERGKKALTRDWFFLFPYAPLLHFFRVCFLSPPWL